MLLSYGVPLDIAEAMFKWVLDMLWRRQLLVLIVAKHDSIVRQRRTMAYQHVRRMSMPYLKEVA